MQPHTGCLVEVEVQRVKETLAKRERDLTLNWLTLPHFLFVVRVGSLPVASPRSGDAQLADSPVHSECHPERRSKQRRLRRRVVAFRLIADRIVAFDGGSVMAGRVVGNRAARRQHPREVADRDPLARIGEHLTFTACRPNKVGDDQIVELLAKI